MLSPELLTLVKKRIDRLLQKVLSGFIDRVPNAHPEKIWERRFNLEIVAEAERIDCIALYVVLPLEKGLKFNTKNMTELFFSIRSKQEILEVYANLTDSSGKLIERGNYMYAPLTYQTHQQSFNGSGLHPKLHRKLAIDITRKEVYAKLIYDQSCIILVQETLDKGNYIAIDEVIADKNMVSFSCPLFF